MLANKLPVVRCHSVYALVLEQLHSMPCDVAQHPCVQSTMRRPVEKTSHAFLAEGFLTRQSENKFRNFSEMQTEFPVPHGTLPRELEQHIYERQRSIAHWDLSKVYLLLGVSKHRNTAKSYIVYSTCIHDGVCIWHQHALPPPLRCVGHVLVQPLLPPSHTHAHLHFAEHHITGWLAQLLAPAVPARVMACALQR